MLAEMEITHVPVRFPEIDVARGIAVIMMVVFHTAFDLRFLGCVPLNVSTGFLRLLALSTASLFLFLVGVSLSISAAHAGTRLTRKDFILKYVIRGAFIFALGMGISAVTRIVIPSEYVRFGILHLIGFSVMASPLYSRSGWQSLLLGAVFIALGPVMAGIRGSPWLLVSGIHPPEFSSVDYVPVFPWMGLVLTGVFAGTAIYPAGKRRPGSPGFTFPPLEVLGRHSLAIYLVHQPVIIAVILLFSAVLGMNFAFPAG
ncbi:MAG TPA: heparan-alpha-glucosaminide N-acetyltransferase [Methanoregulaceae archaeon]|nr:heparan-alpha-glucosaminide N-acetyltransferase [Methanoregulaceae archaeon]HPD10568.1 heparan-alpha-glucosaminide N-acetyltransferase [Methanoregulaceae archaeon]HRT15583.1 heparan-alpha-glucosaminide N-acetyltransferase [Methanoregulaceae archaeon]HRU31155.1 heparan-alpha-glucosaminide N-acetyltransferase [Methanoregulaceae archaeon]